ncbi:hypothetical protein Goklo_008592 [Gossypium klotzschianum]|uniref:Cytochrome c-552/DMSO reductase-like haem-binding domain-containing protein n=1 Tax=Gossypium klotzschianum TaxID=34286 RepID=A0A7J8V0B2_9ROSI|nr:hypothetical protein [Gossypium klotzschianum]
MVVRLLLLAFLVFGFGLTRRVNSHEESGERSCVSNSEEMHIQADFKPGIITLDGCANDWEDIDGSEFSLRPALDPDEDHEYKDGKMTVKALHDGNNVFFLLQVDGNYVYSKGDIKKCPSVALMFQIGDNATYHNMGGCKEQKGSCTNKTCKGHEVDLMHFVIGNAIPGRLYGGGDNSFGPLVDAYAWNPHCRYLNGMGPSGKLIRPSYLRNHSSGQNNWKGAWWHSSFADKSFGFVNIIVCWSIGFWFSSVLRQWSQYFIFQNFNLKTRTLLIGFVEEDSPYSKGGEKGTYYFEFARPLRTMDRLQQDVQFTIDWSSKMSVAFWYPVDGKQWVGSGHYTINCDWASLDIACGSVLTDASRSGWDMASAFALLFSVAALCIAIFVSYHVSRPNTVKFAPVENL